MNNQEYDESIEVIVTCPKCGFRGTLDDFDCIGACNNNLFCTQCSCEFDSSTGVIHKCKTDAMQAARNRELGIVCKGE